MKPIQLGKHKYKYFQASAKDDMIMFPLSYGVIGLNNRLYVSLGSYSFEKGDDQYNRLKKVMFSDDDLRLGCLVRFFELDVVKRDENADTEEEEYVHYKNDFKDIYKAIKEHSKQIEDGELEFYASLNDIGGETDKELGVIYLPLGSDVLRQAVNYAYQEIELLKMENFMNNLSECVQLQQFINIF
jgi:hypothetical protein